MNKPFIDADHLARAIRDSVGPSDEDSKAGRLDAIRERFDRTSKIIATRQSYLLDQTDDDLVIRQIGDLARLLRSVTDDSVVLGVLAKFLDSVQCPSLARQILGLPSQVHAPSKTHLTHRAAAAYELAIGNGMGDEAAIRMAYNAYRPTQLDQPDRWSADSVRLTTHNGLDTNEAEKFVDKELR